MRGGVRSSTTSVTVTPSCAPCSASDASVFASAPPFEGLLEDVLEVELAGAVARGLDVGQVRSEDLVALLVQRERPGQALDRRVEEDVRHGLPQVSAGASAGSSPRWRYSASLLRSVRMLMPRSRAAWV